MDNLFFGLGVIVCFSYIFHFVTQGGLTIWIFTFTVGKITPLLKALKDLQATQAAIKLTYDLVIRKGTGHGGGGKGGEPPRSPGCVPRLQLLRPPMP